jgi:hypothetical protein
MRWLDLLARLRAGGVRQDDPQTAEILAAAARTPAGVSRRTFLRTALVATAAAATVDVEQLLWTPGSQTIWLPPATHTFDTVDWITREALRILQNKLAISAAFNRDLEQRLYRTP